jgi:hypothetical protein
VAGSQLVVGFTHPLSSLPLIQKAIDAQNAALASGQTVDTGISADNFVNPPAQGNGLSMLDPGSYQNAAHPPLSPGQLATFTGQKSTAPVFGSPGGRGFAPLGF